MMIDFKKLFDEICPSNNRQKRIMIESPIAVYFGVSDDGYLRISFMSQYSAPHLDSTQSIRVIQGLESEGVFWTCFDLLRSDAKDIFYVFCNNMVETIEKIDNEIAALNLLKKQYISWKNLFKKKKENKISHEILQGLFGELYFLKNTMINIYGINDAIKSWSGPDLKSKDFSIGEDWYEVKTIGEKANDIHISSIAQLSSQYDGHLIVIKVEPMSDVFGNGESSIIELFNCILSEIKDENIENLLLEKMSSYGIDISDDSLSVKFCIKHLYKYKVNNEFPRILESDIKYAAVSDVNYSLSMSAINNFLEE